MDAALAILAFESCVLSQSSPLRLLYLVTLLRDGGVFEEVLLNFDFTGLLTNLDKRPDIG